MHFGGNRRWVPLIGAVSRTFTKIKQLEMVPNCMSET